MSIITGTPLSPPATKVMQREIDKKVTDDLGWQGLFDVEPFVKGGKVRFSEVSLRPHGTSMVAMCTQRFNEFELHARTKLAASKVIQVKA